MLGRTASTTRTNQATATAGTNMDTPTTYAVAAATYAVAAAKTRRWFLCAATTCEHDDGTTTANGTSYHATYHADDGTTYHATNDAINLADNATSNHGATPRNATCLQHDWNQSFWTQLLTVRGGR